MISSININFFFIKIYDGLWGYNSLLSMAAAGCVFFPFSPVALGTGTVNALATILIQAALRVSMDKVGR